MLAGTSIEVVLGMPFLPLSDADMGLQRACLEELHNAEVMLFGHHQVSVEFIDKREYAVATLGGPK